MYKNSNTLLDLNSPFFNYQDIFSQNLFLLGALSPLHLGTNTQNLSFKPSQSYSAEPAFISAEPTDIPGDLTTTAVLTDGVSFTGMISHAEDEDWFQFTVTDNQIVRFTISSADTSDFRMHLMDDTGALIQAHQAQGVDISTRFTATRISDAGTYYVNADLLGSIGTEYTITFDIVTNDLPNNINTTATLNAGNTFSGIMDYRFDVDWIAIELSPDEVVRFTISGTNATYINLRTATEYLTYSQKTLVLGNIDTAGTYYLEISSNASYSEYTITSVVIEDDIGRSVNTSGQIGINDSIMAEQNYSGDTDWFRIDIATAGVLNIAQFFEGRPGAPVMGLYDANGEVIKKPNQFSSFSAYIDAPGTYYISTQSRSKLTIDYTLTTEFIIDVEGDATTTETLGTNGYFTQYFDTDTDHDWYAFTVEAGGVLFTRIDATVRSTITIRDINGVEITHIDTDYTRQVSLNYTFSEGGTYYLDYTPQPGVNPVLLPSQYNINYSIFGADLAADTNTTESISIGTSVRGLFEEAGDKDWMSFTANEGQFLQFILSTDKASLRIYDQNGVRLDISDAIDTGEHDKYINFTATESGLYFIEMDRNVSFDGFLSYALTLTAPSDDFAQAPNTAGQITTATPATGVFEYLGDEDWFAITVNSGDIFRFAADNSSGNDSDYPTLSLYDSEGVALTLINASSSSYVFDYAFNEAGTYYVAVSGADSADDLASPYELTATALADDYLSSIDTTGTLVVDGASATGANQFEGDADWFAFSVAESGSIINFSITSKIYEATRAAWVVYDDEGNVVSTLNSNSATSNFLALHTGNYFVSLQFNSSATYNLPADYTLTATTYTDDYLANTSTTAALTLGTQISGFIDHTYDRDWLSIDVVAGQTLNFELNQTGGFSGAIRQLTLINADGEIIDSDRVDTGNTYTSIMSHTFTSTGTFYVEVSNNYTGLPSYYYPMSYTLSVDTGVQLAPYYGSISGTLLDDIMRGSAADDYLYGGALGDDTLYGGGGDDILLGYSGNDYLDGGSGRDVARYAESNRTSDLIVRDNMDGTYTVQYTRNTQEFGTDTLVNIEYLMIGGIEYDITELARTVEFSDTNDTYTGGIHGDYLDGLGGNDSLFGAGGQDVIYGRAGEDRLYGGEGIDILHGGEGNDRLYGGTGDDRLYGDAGADVFIIAAEAGNDRIADFENGIDRIAFIENVYTYEQLKIYQDGYSVIIASSNGVITLANTSLADIDASDFIFKVSSDANKGNAESAENAELIISETATTQEEYIAEFLANTVTNHGPDHHHINNSISSMPTPDDDSYFDVL